MVTLASFVKNQAERCDIEGWHMVVLGDINAFTFAEFSFRWIFIDGGSFGSPAVASLIAPNV